MEVLRVIRVITELRLLKSETSLSVMQNQAWRDTAFYAAVLAGPVCWLILVGVGQPVVGPPSMMLWLKLSLLMPVLEEIVFRGGIQAALFSRPFFARQWCGISFANLITSVLFASMHLISQPPIWAALVFIPSLVFGWARDRYKALLPGILLHSVYNAGFIGLFVAG